jgi:hypothetical protein
MAFASRSSTVAATFASIRKRPPGTVVEKAAIPDSPPLQDVCIPGSFAPNLGHRAIATPDLEAAQLQQGVQAEGSFNRLAGEAQGRMVRDRVVSAI